MQSSQRINYRKTVAISLYGVAVIASGMMRYFGDDGGETGLIFGIVMGGISLIAASVFVLQKKWIASVLAWFSVIVVGGWFVYEALIKKGLQESETRQLVLIVGSVIVAFMLALPQRSSTGQSLVADDEG